MSPGPAVPATPLRRGAWLEVDLRAIVENVATIRGVVGDGVAIAPVVKADAYGHGLVPIAHALADVADALCVATLDEGLALRAGGIGSRIILLYPVPPDGVAEAIRAAIEPTVMSDRDADAVARAASRAASRSSSSAAPEAAVRVQLAIETGMNRGGVQPGEAVAVARRLLAAPGVVIAGTWTHHCCPEDPAVASAQDARFEAALAALEEAGIDPGERHAASSGGIFAVTAPHGDLVRPGLATYGLLGDDLPLTAATADAAARLRPALALKARPVDLGDVAAGSTVGYGATWRAAQPSRIATLPVGYGDGFARATQPGGAALVRGRRVPLVGIVSMDAVGVDVTDVEGVGTDDEFVLLGSQGDERISASDLARTRNTIAWEVLSAMAARLDRVYHRATAAGSLRITIDRPRGKPP